MKKIFMIFFIISGIMAIETSAQIKAITFNIRYGLADDGENSWKFRNHLVFDFINRENGDFVGLQEALLFQINEIMDNCPEYSYVGRSREADASEGEASPILYLHDTWEPLESKTLWLSETPEIPGSKSWNSSLPRIFTWARFKNKKDGHEIIIYNTHFDHISAEARYHSSRTIITYINHHHKKEDIILLGDFNATEESDPVNYLIKNDKVNLKDAYREIHPDVKDKDATFYGWKEHIPGEGKRIDYIFYKGNLKPEKVYVSDFNVDKQYPSDHLPVIGLFK